MATSVAKFVEFIRSTDEQKNAQRFAICNFFATYLPQQKELALSDIEQFYLTALKYEHWQNNVSLLSEQLTDLLERFSRKVSLGFATDSVSHGDQWQLVHLKSPDDQKDCLDEFLTRHCASNDLEFKIISLSETRQVALIRGKEKIKVNAFTPTWYIKQGRLHPMNPATQLTYTNTLEFCANTGQFLELAPHTQFFFNLNNIFFGCYMRGYCMQKTNPVQFRMLSECPDIYSRLKGLESLYISVESDPEYQNLVRLLEKATELLKTSAPGSVKLAEKALAQGKYSLENLFPNDKYLYLLISQLELIYMKLNLPEEKNWQWQHLNNPQSDLTNI